MAKKPEVSPYRRFTMILGSFVVLFGLILSIAAILMITNYVLNDTVKITKLEIQEHFAKLPFFANTFIKSEGNSENKPTNNSYYSITSEPEEDEMSGMDHAGDAPTDSTALDVMVRMHFDVYSIEEANFYFPDGAISFSYQPEMIGKYVPDSKIGDLQEAASGGLVHQRLAGHMLNLWTPIYNDEKQIMGIVEITRDISVQDADALLVQLGLMAIILVGMAVMFFSLRQVFISSTRTIDQKNSQLKMMVNTIERTYDESLQALSSALDSRDHETQGHSYRVTLYAVRLGQELNLSQEELGFLARGALLHDVGKIGVPDAILLKPSPLTAEEWVIMKSHVNIGYQMLKHIEFLKPSLDLVLYHHERWDGQGYPNQLQGKEIPLFACIFALCDTYDAITSDRPYRKARGYEEALTEINRCVATQFNHEVVQAFLRIPEEEWTSIQRMSVSHSNREMLEQMLSGVSIDRLAG